MAARFETELDPCPSMEQWLSRLTDGTLTGMAARYTRFHARHCGRCRTALEGLTALRERLDERRTVEAREPATLSAERWAALESALERAE